MNSLLDDYKSIDNADRMTTAGGVTYTYNNKNQTGRGADVFGWDIEDRLTSATVGGNPVSYTYRGDDLRHSKTEAGVTTTFIWDLAAELPVVLQEGNTTYVYGLGLISQTTGSATSYPLADGLGSSAALTDASGAVTATYAYDVFGAVKSSTGPGSTEFRFAGQQDDPALGYQYLRARYYDPSTGRFISKDPFRGLLGNPQTQSTYPYVQNNPVNLVDPTGLCPLCFGALVGGVAALVSSAAKGETGWALVKSTAIGAGLGAAATLGLAPLLGSVAQTIVGSSIAGAAGSYAGQRLSGDKKVSTGLVLASGVVGGFAGFAGLALGGGYAGTVGSGAVSGLFNTWVNSFMYEPKHQVASIC